MAAALPVSVQIRDSIKSLFPDRDCYTLVRPMHDERALNHLDALDSSQLRPEFSQVRMSILLVDSEKVMRVDKGMWSSLHGMHGTCKRVD